MATSKQLPAIRHKTFIAATPAEVYRNIATNEGLDSWFTDGSKVDPRPGGTITFRWRKIGRDRVNMTDGGAILEAIPGRRFAFRWKPGASYTTVMFDLEPQADGTMVTVTESGYKNTRRDIEAMLGTATGWGEALTLLKFHIERGGRYGVVPKASNQKPSIIGASTRSKSTRR